MAENICPVSNRQQLKLSSQISYFIKRKKKKNTLMNMEGELAS